ncbi:MAG: TRAFAC clade GTPase domain-containing protein [Janthinobacterium lividum]
MPPAPIHSCSNAECKVRVDGTCAEGRSLRECPYYAGSELKQGAAAYIGEALVIDEDLKPLEEAVRLSSSEAAAHLTEYESTVVAVIGPSAAGKTCLIAGLHHLFQQGPVGPFEFAGSKTLHAFEEVGHGARLESGFSEPESERTLSGPAKFFELTLGTVGRIRKRRVLIADRWGEDYQGVLDSHPRPEEFFEVARADVLTMLVDGQRILDPGSRYEVAEEAMATLQVFLEVGLLARSPHLAVVLTKLDIVLDESSRERALADFARLVFRIEGQFATRVTGVSSFRTAASPKVMAAMRGEGLRELLRCWMEDRRLNGYVRQQYARRRPIDSYPRREEV